MEKITFYFMLLSIILAQLGRAQGNQNMEDTKKILSLKNAQPIT